MTKKILLIIVALIVLIIAYLAVRSEKSSQVAEGPQEITVETRMSSDSAGYGAVQLIDHENNEYYCNLIDAESCDYKYEGPVAMKLVALPAEGFVFDGWISGCDSISTWNINNDTCEINVYQSKRTTEVRFR